MDKDHQILHERFKKYGLNAREWMRKCILLLPEIAKHRIWEQKGFGSIYEYAAKLAGMSRDTVDDALRIMRRIADKPALQKVVEIKGINAIRPVVTIATAETAEFWAEKAKIMSKNTLEVYVREIRKQENFRTSTENMASITDQQAISDFNKEIDRREAESDLFQKITIELEPEVLEQLEKLKGKGSWNDLFKAFLYLRFQQFEAPKPQPVKTESRHIPVKIQKYVVARTNGLCSYPSCKAPTRFFTTLNVLPWKKFMILIDCSRSVKLMSG